MIKSHSAVSYPIAVSETRHDLIVGFLFSLGCFATLLGLSEAMKRTPLALPRPPVPVTVQFVMPKAEPDEEVVETTTAPLAPAETAPPMLADLPQIPRMDQITIRPEIIPSGIAIDPKALTVPKDIGTGRGPQIFNPSMLDQQPAATFQPAPVFPYDLKQAGTTGTVVVDFILEADGHVSSAFAASSSAHAFETNAIEAVLKWRFRPGRRGGHAVRTHMVVPINFTLQNP